MFTLDQDFLALDQEIQREVKQIPRKKQKVKNNLGKSKNIWEHAGKKLIKK